MNLAPGVGELCWVKNGYRRDVSWPVGSLNLLKRPIYVPNAKVLTKTLSCRSLLTPSLHRPLSWTPKTLQTGSAAARRPAGSVFAFMGRVSHWYGRGSVYVVSCHTHWLASDMHCLSAAVIPTTDMHIRLRLQTRSRDYYWAKPVDVYSFSENIQNFQVGGCPCNAQPAASPGDTHRTPCGVKIGCLKGIVPSCASCGCTTMRHMAACFLCVSCAPYRFRCDRLQTQAMPRKDIEDAFRAALDEVRAALVTLSRTMLIPCTHLAPMVSHSQSHSICAPSTLMHPIDNWK